MDRTKLIDFTNQAHEQVGKHRLDKIWTAQTFLDIPEAIIHGNEGDVYEQHAIYG